VLPAQLKADPTDPCWYWPGVSVTLLLSLGVRCYRAQGRSSQRSIVDPASAFCLLHLLYLTESYRTAMLAAKPWLWQPVSECAWEGSRSVITAITRIPGLLR